MYELLRIQDALITRMASVFYDAKVQEFIPFGLADDVKAHIQEQRAEKLLNELGPR